MNSTHPLGGRPKDIGRGLPKYVSWANSKTKWEVHIRHPVIGQRRRLIEYKSSRYLESLETAKSEKDANERRRVKAEEEEAAVNKAITHLRDAFPNVPWDKTPEKRPPSLPIPALSFFRGNLKKGKTSSTLLGDDVKGWVSQLFKMLAKKFGTDPYGVRFIALIVLIDLLCKRVTERHAGKVADALNRDYSHAKHFRRRLKFLSNRKAYDEILEEDLRSLPIVLNGFQRDEAFRHLLFGEDFDKKRGAQRRSYLRHLLNIKSVKDALWNSARMGARHADENAQMLPVKPQAVRYLNKLKDISENSGSNYIANTHIKLGRPPLFREETYGNEGGFSINRGTLNAQRGRRNQRRRKAYKERRMLELEANSSVGK
jgi:hypothetical protein